MRFLLDGEPAELTEITYNDGLGFRRFDSDGITIHPYEMFIERTDLIEKIGDRYRTVCEEIREDDRRYGDTSDFTPMGYCGLDDAFAFPEQLAEVIDTYFVQGIFAAYLEYRETFTYVINSVDRVTITHEGVRIEGRCFRHSRGE